MKKIIKRGLAGHRTKTKSAGHYSIDSAILQISQLCECIKHRNQKCFVCGRKRKKKRPKEWRLCHLIHVHGREEGILKYKAYSQEVGFTFCLAVIDGRLSHVIACSSACREVVNSRYGENLKWLTIQQKKLDELKAMLLKLKQTIRQKSHEVLLSLNEESELLETSQNS